MPLCRHEIFYIQIVLSAKFLQLAGRGAGDLTLTSNELSRELIGVDAQEPLAGFEPKAFFHTCGEHSPHLVFPGA
jgi:hypothetical protein